MKVFLATLLIVGLAAALPSPKSIIENLKTQLTQDVSDIKSHTKQLFEQVSTHAKEDTAAVIQNPFLGLKTLIENLSKDAQDVIGSTISDANKVNEHIQTAVNELSQVDAAPMVEILDNLKEQMKGDVKDVKASVQALLKQALAHVGDDVKALLTNPSGAQQIIQDNWNMDFNQFLKDGQGYVDTVQKQVQEALDKMKQQIDQ